MLDGLRFKKSTLDSVNQIHPPQVKRIQSLADQIPPQLRRARISSAKDCIRSTCQLVNTGLAGLAGITDGFSLN